LLALHGLGAIDNSLAVTKLGHQMLKFPLEPSQARVLLASVARSCTADVLDILALVNDSPIFLDPLDKRDEAGAARAGFSHRDGDHLTLLNVLRSYEAIPKRDAAGRKAWCRARFVNERNLKRAIQARDQMRDICEREGVDWQTRTEGDDSEPVLRCLVEGMFNRCAVWSGGEYRQIVGNSVHSWSSLVPPAPERVR
jgi:ATP-dependent RNA helicase DHX33